MNGRKSFRYIITVVIAVIGLVALVNVSPKRLAVDEYYVYPMNSSGEEWNNLTIQEKIETCRIPKRIVKNMSDEQLIQAVIDFPFIHEVFLYDYIETGVKSLENVSDAYKELISRESALNSLMNYVSTNVPRLSDEITAEQELINDALALIIVYQEKFQDSLTESDLKKISEISTMVEYNSVQGHGE